MKKRIISLILVFAILIPFVPTSSAASTSYLSADSATKFLSFLSGNAFYKPKSGDLYYSLLTGQSDSLTLKQAFLALVYNSVNSHLYETRLNSLKIRLEKDLPQTMCDATLEVVSGAVKDELIESFSGIGDAGDIWEGLGIILNSVFLVFNVRGLAKSAYFSAMLGIDPNDEFYELKADANALTSGVGKDRDMVDEWIAFMYAIEQDVMGKAEPITPPPATYTITFNPNCSELSSVTYTHTQGMGNVIPPTFTREGYIFAGWTFDAEGTASASGNILIDRNLMFYATWIKRSQTITFDSNCNEVPDVIRMYDTFDENRTYPEMKRPGYAFDGWYFDAACTQPVTSYSSLTSQTFYAKWLSRYNYKRENGGITITKLLIAEGTDENNITDVIPSTIDGLPVLKIGDKAFYNLRTLTSVTIPEGVTSIGKNAFYNCYSLTSVSLPSTLTTIDEGAFHYCSMWELDLPKNLTTIGNYAFSNCNLYDITLPDSLKTIGNCAFANNGFYSFTIPDGVTTIGYGIVDSCLDLKTIHIGKGLENVSSMWLFSCQSLKSITVDEDNQYFCSIDGVLYSKDKSILYYYPENDYSRTSYTIADGCTTIYPEAFSCAKVANIKMPDTVTSIGKRAFYYTRNLKDIYLSKSLTSLGAEVFSGSYITSLTIPESVTEIAANTFYMASDVTDITFKGKITSIGKNAFGMCFALKDVYLNQTENEWSKVKIESGNNYLTKATFHYIDAVIHTAKAELSMLSDGTSEVEALIGEFNTELDAMLSDNEISAEEITRIEEIKSEAILRCGVLNVRFQIESGTTKDSEKSDIRFIATVDHLNYRETGFYITAKGKKKRISTRTVYANLIGKNNEIVTTYSPEDLCSRSKWFSTYSIMNVPQSAFSENIIVQPFIVTKNGKEILGVEKARTINHFINK